MGQLTHPVAPEPRGVEEQRLHALHEATSADLGSGEPKRGPKEPQMDLGGGRLAVHHMGAAGVHRLGYWWGDSGERACAAGASIEATQTTYSASQVPQYHAAKKRDLIPGRRGTTLIASLPATWEAGIEEVASPTL